MINENIILIKIGGSIIKNKDYLINTLNQIHDIIAEKIINKCIIICGGGKYADFIRTLDSELKIDPSLSHWMAIKAMDVNIKDIYSQYISYFSKENIVFTEIYENLKKLINEKESKLIFFAPFRFLKLKDELPHSWDVTSDSIALFLSFKLGLKTTYLIKDVDGIFLKNNDKIPCQTISVAKLKEYKKNNLFLDIDKNSMDSKKASTPIDIYSCTLIEKHKISCILLNGASPQKRIYKYFINYHRNLNISLNQLIFTKIHYD